MKKTMILAAVLMVTAAQAEVSMAPVRHLYVPSGFDSNDSVEVVVTGLFPNLCYSRNTISVKMQGERIAIEVSAIRRDTKGACPQMQVPFKEVVALGNLQGGTYELVVNNQLTDRLVVDEADSNAVDDHHYAAIEQIVKTGNNNYVLNGTLYSHCLQYDHVEIISNGKDTLSVLPVMKQVSDFCPMKGTPMSIPVSLDFKTLKTKEPLIHVRTMDGKSFNTVLNLTGLK